MGSTLLNRLTPPIAIMMARTFFSSLINTFMHALPLLGNALIHASAPCCSCLLGKGQASSRTLLNPQQSILSWMLRMAALFLRLKRVCHCVSSWQVRNSGLRADTVYVRRTVSKMMVMRNMICGRRRDILRFEFRAWMTKTPGVRIGRRRESVEIRAGRGIESWLVMVRV